MTEKPHVYDANLEAGADLQEFFEGDSLVIATRFFRNDAMFREMEEVVIPGLLAKGVRKRGELTIWSAGCSDGREAYSLAMAASRGLDKAGANNVKVKVRASDISRPQIEIGRQGQYQLTSKDGAMIRDFGEYFDVLDQKRAVVSDSIKKQVDFVVEDIIKHTPRRPYDILMCSLVVLYYKQEYQLEIVEGLLERVKDEGVFHIQPVNKRWLSKNGYVPISSRFIHYGSMTHWQH